MTGLGIFIREVFYALGFVLITVCFVVGVDCYFGFVGGFFELLRRGGRTWVWLQDEIIWI